MRSDTYPLIISVKLALLEGKFPVVASWRGWRGRHGPRGHQCGVLTVDGGRHAPHHRRGSWGRRCRIFSGGCGADVHYGL